MLARPVQLLNNDFYSLLCLCTHRVCDDSDRSSVLSAYVELQGATTPFGAFPATRTWHVY
jgi:hypothetical protein